VLYVVTVVIYIYLYIGERETQGERGRERRECNICNTATPLSYQRLKGATPPATTMQHVQGGESVVLDAPVYCYPMIAKGR
jgi:hypothetical protein